MSVTLDVSKLSGWLNAHAYCRVERRGGYATRGEVRAGEAEGRGAAAAHAARTAGPDCEGWRAGAERTSNMPPISVTLDVSKLSGWLNTDASCRAQGGACDAGRGAGGGGRAWSGGGASGAQREGLTIKGWGAGAKRTSNM